MIDLSGVENYTDVLTDYAKRKERADIFGITATTPQVPYAVKISQHLKALCQEKTKQSNPWWSSCNTYAHCRKERQRKKSCWF